MNKLPKVFVNPINKIIDNDQKNYRSYKDSYIRKNITSLDIDNIINSKKYINGTKVKILINNEYLYKTIITRQKDYLITIDNEKIFIKDIDDIMLI